MTKGIESLCTTALAQIESLETYEEVLRFLSDVKNMEYLKRTSPFARKTTIIEGDSVLDYLQRYMPSRFRTEFAAEFTDVSDFLKSGKTVSAKFVPLDGMFAQLDGSTNSILINLQIAKNSTPILVFAKVRHEIRHVHTQLHYLPKLKWVASPHMSEDQFVKANRDVLLKDEAVSRYADYLFWVRLMKSDYFKPFAAELVRDPTYVYSEFVKAIAEKKPKPGKEAIEFAIEFVKDNPGYCQMAEDFMKIYYRDVTGRQGLPIESLNNTPVKF